jgi:transposase-like protein
MVEKKRGERYCEKFRRRVVKRMNACDNIMQLSVKLGVHRRLLYKWRDDLEKLDRQAEGEMPVLNSHSKSK